VIRQIKKLLEQAERGAKLQKVGKAAVPDDEDNSTGPDDAGRNTKGDTRIITLAVF
jgi:hypothetical protein